LVKFNSKSMIKILVASVLSVVMFLCFSLQPQVYANGEQTDSFTSNYEVVSDNDQELVIQTSIPDTKESTVDSNARFFSINKSESDEITGSMKINKKTKEITLKTNEKSEVTNENEKTYSVVINDVKENGDIDAVFTDMETNESFVIEQDKLEASFVWFIPIGVVIGEWLLGQLLAAGTALLIAGIAYVAISESGVLEKVRNDKTVDHYIAKIMSGKLWIGGAIPLTDAVARLMNPVFVITEKNVYSRTSALAMLVAATAGGGKPTVGPELNCNQLAGNFYYAHYHAYNRAGGHSFF
jgi:hypothetical protein